MLLNDDLKSKNMIEDFSIKSCTLEDVFLRISIN